MEHQTRARPDGFTTDGRRSSAQTYLPPKIVVVVVAVAIAVVIVVASIPVEVEAPFRAPEFPWAPVVQRRRAKAGLGLGGTRRQPQTSAHQHRRCKPYDSSFHDYFHAPVDALGGFVLTWPGSYKSLKVAGRIGFSTPTPGLW